MDDATIHRHPSYTEEPHADDGPWSPELSRELDDDWNSEPGPPLAPVDDDELVELDEYRGPTLAQSIDGDAEGRIEAKLDVVLDELRGLNRRLDEYAPLLDEAQRRLEKRNRLLGRNR